ncbi:DUF5658 family protein [Cytobacillus luteolus]|uniref:DUF5658 family protein n=1 Tax=Litchfieldia luteola TaxID=682179 RepID=UPI001D0BEB10
MLLLFHTLALLNLLDGILTFIGLQFSIISESNPIMNLMYQHDPGLFLTLKIVLSLLLYILIFTKKMPLSSLIKRLTQGATVCYVLVIMVHCYWFLPFIY